SGGFAAMALTITLGGYVRELSGVRPPEPPVFLPRSSRWIVGADLGQARDPTAVCGLEHAKGVIDRNGPRRRDCGVVVYAQEPCERMNVRYLQRLALGTPYPAVVQHIRDLLKRPPLNGDARSKPAELVIDESGVGRAVGDIFEAAGLKPIRITITSG